jgi:capsular polysaccharide transport system permease protein
MAEQAVPSIQETMRAARNQFDVLRSVLYREAMMRFGRKTLGIIEDVGGIVLMICLFVFLRTLAGLHSHRGMDIVPFIATGVLNFYTFRATAQKVTGFYASTNGYAGFTSVTPLDVVLARAFLNIVIHMVIMLGALVVMRYFNWSPEPRNVLMIFVIMFVSGVFGMALGILMGAIIFFARPMILFQHIFMRVMMFTSGVFFVIPEIPYRVRHIAIYNPILHLSDLMRSIYFSTYETRASLTYVGVFLLLMIFAALTVERAMRPWTQQRAT